jgi:hypothetical protein
VFVKNGRYYGCLFSANHRHRLPVHNRHDAVNHVTLAGRYVAYADRICSEGGAGLLCGITVHVIHLTNGSGTHTDHVAPAYAEGDTYGFVDRLVLLNDGDLAWSYDQSGGLVGPNPQIRKSDADGERIVLDNQGSDGSSPDTLSLYLGSDGNLHWVRHVYNSGTGAYDDEVRSAPLH